MIWPVPAEQSRAWCDGGPQLSQQPLSFVVRCDAADSKLARGVSLVENMTVAKMTVSVTEALSPGFNNKQNTFNTNCWTNQSRRFSLWENIDILTVKYKWMWTDYLGVVVDKQFGDTTLSVHQETISSPLLSECRLVTCSNQCVQLTLATTHQLHKLKEKSDRFHWKSEHTYTCAYSPAYTITWTVLKDRVTFNSYCEEREMTCDIISCLPMLLCNDNKIQKYCLSPWWPPMNPYSLISHFLSQSG